jgi:outer membrane protein OmpA-like peptidoglycan-associated protein
VENASSGANEPPDESTLLPAVENTPNAVGTVLAHYPALRIAVGGHTDAIGSDAYN